MINWCIKGGEELYDFFHQNRDKFKYIAGNDRDFYYWWNPTSKKVTWSVEFPTGCELVTIEQLRELYAKKPSTKDRWTVKGSKQLANFLDSNTIIFGKFPKRGYEGAATNLFYHWNGRILSGSSVDIWDYNVITIEELQKLYAQREMTGQQIQYNWEQLKQMNGYPFSALIRDVRVNGIIKFDNSNNKLIFLQNEVAGVDSHLSHGYVHSYVFTESDVRKGYNSYNTITDFYIDVDEFELIKEYPGRKVGDVVKLVRETAEFTWKSDGVLLPKEFQPDQAVHWFKPIYVVSLPIPRLNNHELTLSDFNGVFFTKGTFGCQSFSPGHLTDIYGGLNNLMISEGYTPLAIKFNNLGEIPLSKIKEILDYINQQEEKEIKKSQPKKSVSPNLL
jgi:hypothetical protein